MSARSPLVTVITDGDALCDVLIRHARAVFGENSVRGFLYSQSEVYLPRLLDECELFILELFRNYPGGLRAEGVALGNNLVQRGKRTLIFSPLSLSGIISSRFYWDTTDSRSPREALKDLLGQDSGSREDWRRIREVFAKHLPIPPQHKS